MDAIVAILRGMDECPRDWVNRVGILCDAFRDCGMYDVAEALLYDVSMDWHFIEQLTGRDIKAWLAFRMPQSKLEALYTP